MPRLHSSRYTQHARWYSALEFGNGEVTLCNRRRYPGPPRRVKILATLRRAEFLRAAARGAGGKGAFAPGALLVFDVADHHSALDVGNFFGDTLLEVS